MTLDYIRKNNLIGYEYIRGSKLHGISTPQSDTDLGGVFFCDFNNIVGLRSTYPEQVSDSRSDETYYEYGRWIELLGKSNPNALESLYVPKKFIIGYVEPAVQLVIDNRDKFLSKECFASASGYAVSQLKKCRGLNKKIVNQIHERKTPLDFCFTFNGEGSVPLKEWLETRGLKQELCGVSAVNNMPDMYCLFYDHEGTIGYRGIIKENGNDIHLSSIPKNQEILCHFMYNENSYKSHCREYKEYKEWEKMRNPVRYESNLDKNYDSKNVSECLRMLNMCIEIANGEEMKVNRTEDRQFLLDIRAHKYEYDEIMAITEQKKQEFDEAIKTCTLPDKVDPGFINDILIEGRRLFYKTKSVAF